MFLFKILRMACSETAVACRGGDSLDKGDDSNNEECREMKDVLVLDALFEMLNSERAEIAGVDLGMSLP